MYSPSPKKYGIVLLVLYLSCAADASNNQCVKISAKIQDGVCKGSYVSRKTCTASQSASVVKTMGQAALKELGLTANQAVCDEFYTHMHNNVSNGCTYMNVSHLHTESLCNPTEFCRLIRDSIVRSSTCSTGCAQTSSVTLGSLPDTILCCDFIRKKLKSQCSMQNEILLEKYIGEQIKSAVCMSL